MQERVNRELEGLEEAESKAVLIELDEQIKAAGVNPADYYATMKKKERKSRKN